MKFTDLLNEISRNKPENIRIANAIHAAVKADLLDWGVKFSTSEFVQILGINRRQLDHFINTNDFNANGITLAYSGNEHEYVDLGPDPKVQLQGPNAQDHRIIDTEFALSDPFEDLEEGLIKEGTKVSALDKKQLEKLWDKWLAAMKKKKHIKTADEIKLKKEFMKKDLLAVGKEIQKMSK